MLNLLRCYLSGRHEYGVGCEPGTIFLRCVHCGHRSTGWTVDARATATADRPAPAAVPAPAVNRFAPAVRHLRVVTSSRVSGRVIPFQRSAAH